ncbi:MAG: hypothetical protein M1835_008178 [Candelina submexicana]|nr:MAG: hypothetical protein M1835_008178 [Candelina submexicana]
MPGQISLEPLYEELDFVFNQASLRKAVREFRTDTGGPDQSVFTTIAMQDHTSTVLETMAKSFLEFAQQPQNLSNSSDVPLWRLLLGSQGSNQRTMLLNPEDAERGLARLFEAQNRNLVNRTSSKQRNKHNERPSSGPTVAQKYSDIEDSITVDNPTSMAAQTNTGTRGPSMTQNGKFSAAYTGDSSTATQGLLKRASVSKGPRPPVAHMTPATTREYAPHIKILILDVLIQSTDISGSREQRFEPYPSRLRSSSSLVTPNTCQRDQGHGQNQTQPENEGVGLNGVRRKLVKLKVPQAKMLKVTGSLDGRRPSSEADPTDEQRSPKRLKGRNDGHLLTPTPATLSGPRAVQEPCEKHAFKQTTMDEIEAFIVGFGKKKQDQMKSPMSSPEGLYGHPSHLQIDALDLRNQGEPMHNPHDHVQIHTNNQEPRTIEESILSNASSFDHQAPPINALSSQSELPAASYGINLSAVTIPNHNPRVLIESAGQDSRASTSASSPSDHAAMAGRDCNAEEMESPQDHTRNTAASHQDGRKAEGEERYLSRSHNDDQNTQQVGEGCAVSESNNLEGNNERPDTSVQDGSQSRQPAELEDRSPLSTHSDNPNTVRPGQDLEEDPRNSSAGD